MLGLDRDQYYVLKKLKKEDQIELMRSWFLQRFTDPVHNSPYESAEGGYIWIYGGPFSSEEILSDEFGKFVKDDIIFELSKDLDSGCEQWTRTTNYDDELYPHDYAEQFFDKDQKVKDLYSLLEANLNSVGKLTDEIPSLNGNEKKFALMMNFSFCITLLETYLSDVFAVQVLNEQYLMERYLKSDKNLSAEKFSLSQLFEKSNEVDSIVRKRISETSFHNMATVNSLYKNVLNVELGDIENLLKLVSKRHDFIHRGGKNVDGVEVVTSIEEIYSLIETVKKLSLKIRDQIDKNSILF